VTVGTTYFAQTLDFIEKHFLKNGYFPPHFDTYLMRFFVK
jgi:hypothetical protein